jgi:hypothetical protein
MLNFNSLLITTIIAFSQVNCIEKQQRRSEEAVLLETSTASLTCGNIAYAQGFRFKLLTGDNKGKAIIGIVPCPDFYGNIFLKGTKFKLELSKNMSNLKGYEIINGIPISNGDKDETKIDTFYVSKIEKLYLPPSWRKQ